MGLLSAARSKQMNGKAKCVVLVLEDRKLEDLIFLYLVEFNFFFFSLVSAFVHIYTINGYCNWAIKFVCEFMRWKETLLDIIYIFFLLRPRIETHRNCLDEVITLSRICYTAIIQKKKKGNILLMLHLLPLFFQQFKS